MAAKEKTEQKNPTPASVAPAQQQTGVELPEFAEKYGWPILAVIALAAIAGMGGYLYKASQDRKDAEASQKLAAARTVADMEKFVTDYSATKTAPVALMILANSYFNAADYDMALNKYIEFKTKHPQNMLIPAAELGRLHCLEARQQTQEAMDGFIAFQKEHSVGKPGHFLAGQAVFGQARCLEQLGQFNEARTVYEDFIAQNPKSEWNSRAKDAIDSVKKKMSRAARQTAEPVGPLAVKLLDDKKPAAPTTEKPSAVNPVTVEPKAK